LDKRVDALTKELTELDGRRKDGTATKADRQRFREVVMELGTAVSESSRLRIRYLLNPRARDAQVAVSVRLAALEATLAKRRRDAAAAEGEPQAPADPEGAALLAEKQQLLGQRQGRYPWFVDPDFPPARPEAPIKAARVTI
jgi:hypothetical protein